MKTPLKKTVRKKNARILIHVISPNSPKTTAISSSVTFQGRFPAKMVLPGSGSLEASSLHATCDVVNDRDAESDAFLVTTVLNATRELMLLVAGSAA
jgi:hypothetical protein